ncbi:MAG: hypothetical protein NZ874_06030 [Fimbriimonadales bacterium]|nr:hypothetical protein [Fimbriimonadales bacterium]
MRAGFRGVGVRASSSARDDGVRAIGSRLAECRRTAHSTAL